MLQSFILQNDTFAIEGLIMDLITNPGVGLWNHTMHILEHGGTWSIEMLWLEHVMLCINKNLSINYTIVDNDVQSQPDTFNLVDQGSLLNLLTVYPTFS